MEDRSYAATDTAAPDLRRAVVAPGASRDSIAYDVRGNIATVTNPLGITTESLSDRIGRVLQTSVPVEGDAGTVFQITTTLYNDLTDQVVETIAMGPAMNDAPQQWLHVRNLYDDEGNITEVKRWSNPDTAKVDTIRTRWEYDFGSSSIWLQAGRKKMDTGPGVCEDGVV